MNQTPYPLHPEPGNVEAPPYPLVPKPRRDSWLERHPHWKILLGCIALVLLVGGFIAFVLTATEGLLRNNDVYQQSVAIAQASPQVQRSIGTPFRVARIISGQIKLNGSDGDAHLVLPIAGSRGSGTIEALAFKTSGVWHFKSLLVRVDGQDEPINLLSENPPTEREF